jgi:hypothetical protein
VSKRIAIASLLLLAASAAADETPLKDPMRPFGGSAGAAAESTAPAPRFALTALVIAPSRRVAVVNGRSYFVGQAVDGATIVAIEPGIVRLQERGTELVLHLGMPGDGRALSAEGDTLP